MRRLNSRPVLFVLAAALSVFNALVLTGAVVGVLYAGRLAAFTVKETIAYARRSTAPRVPEVSTAALRHPRTQAADHHRRSVPLSRVRRNMDLARPRA